MGQATIILQILIVFVMYILYDPRVWISYSKVENVGFSPRYSSQL